MKQYEQRNKYCEAFLLAFAYCRLLFIPKLVVSSSDKASSNENQKPCAQINTDCRIIPCHCNKQQQHKTLCSRAKSQIQGKQNSMSQFRTPEMCITCRPLAGCSWYPVKLVPVTAMEIHTNAEVQLIDLHRGIQIEIIQAIREC